jgi:hypothetical protein
MRNSAVATCPALVVLLAFWEMLAIVPIEQARAAPMPQLRTLTYKNLDPRVSSDYFHLEAGKDIFLTPSTLVDVSATSPDGKTVYFKPTKGVNASTLNMTSATNMNVIPAQAKMKVSATLLPTKAGGGLLLAGSPTSYFGVDGLPPKQLNTTYVAAAIDIEPGPNNTATVSVTNDYGQDLQLSSLIIQQGNTQNFSDPGAFSPDGTTVLDVPNLTLGWNSDPTQTGFFSYTFTVLDPNLPVSIFFDAATTSNLSDIYPEGGAAYVPEPSTFVLAALGGLAVWVYGRRRTVRSSA